MSGARCRTLYPFSGERHGQGLRFVEGELITLLQVPDGGWWEGENEEGLRGWFPASYVQLLEVSDEGGRVECWKTRGSSPGRSHTCCPRLLGQSTGSHCSGTKPDSPLCTRLLAPASQSCKDSWRPSRRGQCEASAPHSRPLPPCLAFRADHVGLGKYELVACVISGTGRHGLTTGRGLQRVAWEGHSRKDAAQTTALHLHPRVRSLQPANSWTTVLL